ncbi:hypothetical protein JW865_06475 [Candidatus Bathyarchaeota archaeon]|nr:hypothetical protein [Candidatus Bathyarchaeota archaeon]
MLYHKNEYLEVKTFYDNKLINIELNNSNFNVIFPKEVWNCLDTEIKDFITDNIAFTSTNYLPLLYKKKGIVYNTRNPVFEPYLFMSTMYDLPSSAELDSKSNLDYIRDYFNLDFIFKPGDSRIWSKSFEPKKKAIISFTSGKESLLTLAVCLELGIEPILVNVIEPSNIYEHKHRSKLLEELSQEFGIKYYAIHHDIGLFHHSEYMGLRNTTLGWGTQLLHYFFIYLPFLLKFKAKYLFYGNEFSCNKEIFTTEGFRANYCFDQSSRWTLQMDNMLRLLTRNSARVGSLVGPLNEIAIIRCLHEYYPELGKYQLSCFCDEPIGKVQRWCCNCSKCARTYAFLKAIGVDPKKLGFWTDMFSENHKELYTVFGGEKTYGFDSSGMGREEQELALFLAAEKDPYNKFLKDYMQITPYINSSEGKKRFKKDYSHYFGVQEYEAIPYEIRQEVYDLFSKILEPPLSSFDKIEELPLEITLPNPEDDSNLN